MQQMQSAFGMAALLTIAWIISENRRAVSLRQAVSGLAVTFATAVLFLKVPGATAVFYAINRGVAAIAEATRAGTAFVFGYIGGGPLPFELKVPGAEFSLAFQALPVVLLISVLTSLLFHWRILPPIVRALSWVLERTLGVGGAVGLSAAANIFLGMIEAPLFIRPYLVNLTRAELFIVMTAGMACIAGTVLVIYATLLAPIIPNAPAHLVVASVLDAPAAILIATIMIPDPAGGRTGAVLVDPRKAASSSMDAIVQGAITGLELLLNITVMLIVLVALVHLANSILSLLPAVAGAPISLQRSLGLLMAPICWLMGIPWQEAATAGSLMGIKTVLNEFIAYVELTKLPPEALEPRSRLITLYAMCGFANFGSLGIMIGGLGAMVPERRADVIALGLKAIISGTLATCLIGSIVGVLN